MEKEIHIFNTKSRAIETFIPIHNHTVAMYSCGPTVYHYAHLGNLRGYITTDIVRRMFVYAGYDVNAVINITDVGHNVDDGDDGEDKMEKGSKREGKSAWDIAAFYTDAYFKDLDALNIPRTSYHFPKATETIAEQIELVKTLVEKGYTYQIHDGIYFDTSKFAAYPDLAKLDVKGLQSGARVEENTEKKNITDFALWKFSPSDEKRQMEWDSPWGKGFPGWHIECSAMSKKILGPHLDIHLGGIDHIPVHHTNEIAQSECANGESYVNYWMHYNFLNDPTGKMSKSKGDFLRLQSILEKDVSPLAYRYYILTAHYRSEVAFSFESLTAASVSYEKLIAFVKSQVSLLGEVSNAYKVEFEKSLFDDVGTPAVIALIWKLLKDTSIKDSDKVATIFHFDEVLGLNLREQSEEKPVSIIIPLSIQNLMDERASAKKNKEYSKADELRNQIEEAGYTIQDTGDKQVLSKK